MSEKSPAPPDGPGGFAQLIGLEIPTVEEGYSRGEVTVTDRLKNPNGVLHGAVAYAMADSGMGAALSTGLAEGEACATIELKVSYLRPVVDGQLVCETRVIRRGGSVAFLEADVTQDGDSVARATGSFAIFET
jgi:acyl-CoA thioesterase